MATLRDIKNRIVGIKNTQQITKAMKMVAAARLRRAQENMINARPYARKVSEVLSNLIALEGNVDNPLFKERPVKKLALVLVTSDKGLCGSFNMNVIKKVESLVKNEYKEYYDSGNLDLYTIGKKGDDHFKIRNFNIAQAYPGIFTKLRFEFASAFVTSLKEKFLSGEVDKVVVVYNKFKSVIQQDTLVEQLFPVIPFETEEVEGTSTEFLYEPNKLEIINNLLPKHLNAQMWKFLLESYASELGARMSAMDMATENANELIRSLQITYNKLRQASITTEILEIVSGADALKGN